MIQITTITTPTLIFDVEDGIAEILRQLEFVEPCEICSAWHPKSGVEDIGAKIDSIKKVRCLLGGEGLDNGREYYICPSEWGDGEELPRFVLAFTLGGKPVMMRPDGGHWKHTRSRFKDIDNRNILSPNEDQPW